MSDLETRWPFTRAQAMAAGITAMMLRGPKFRRLFRGVYVDARVPFHPQIRIRGALLTHPTGAFASHHSAARMYDLPIPDTTTEHVSVFDQSDRRNREGISSHVANEQLVSTLRGIRLSSPVQVFIDLASLLGLVDLVVLGDSKLAIEYDGQQYRGDLKQWDSDISRGDWLERRGWRMLPVISKGIYQRPEQTVERVLSALQQCACPKLPRALSVGWRLHFPVRP